MSGLHYLSVTELSGLIRKRALSPVEVVESQLARIRNLDSALHAYAMVTEDAALEQARRAEAEIASGRYRGSLHGIPVAVKDLFFTKGVRTQGGLKTLSSHIPEVDATAVAQLNRAGAVLLGKLQTTEGAMDGYHRDFEIPRNPWAADGWPGVSSSGPGVAVAAGLCYAALGTDSGGSIRIPSAANGIAGLKPTYGTISTEGVLPLAASFDTVGLMARSVGDAAILFQAMTGEADEPILSMMDVRIGVDETLCSEGVQPCQAEAVRLAVLVLEKLGGRVVPAHLPAIREATGMWYAIAASEAAVAYRGTFPSRASEFGDGFRAFLAMGATISAGVRDLTHKRRKEWSARIAECFRDFDVFVCPTLPGEAFRYYPEDAYRGLGNGIPDAYLTAMDRLVLPFNLTGYPALSLPCGMSADGMPLGLQLVGRPHSESLLIQCGAALENETSWNLRRPPLPI